MIKIEKNADKLVLTLGDGSTKEYPIKDRTINIDVLRLIQASQFLHDDIQVKLKGFI